MKVRLLIVTALFLLGTQAAHAGLFGWHGSVTFTNGASTFTEHFSGPTYAACETNRMIVKSLHPFPPYLVVSEAACVPLVIDFERFIIPEVKIPIPDPGCLSCPYLRKDLLEKIYPEHYESVIRLMDKYRINEYNDALQQLNTQFDLEGFGKEMFHLEQETGQNAKR